MPIEKNKIASMLGVAFLIFALPATAADTRLQLAQAPATLSREDLLDQIVRRMALCAEIGDAARRAACYDRVQSSPEAAAAASPPAPAPMPVAAPPVAAPPMATMPAAAPMVQPSPPSFVVGRGAEARMEVNYPHKDCSQHPINCAYDPMASRPPPGGVQVGAAHELRRSQGPVPAPGYLHPLVSLRIDTLRDTQERWVLTSVVTSGSPKPIDAEFGCMFTNHGQPVREMTYVARALRPGESAVVEMVGPTVTASYVDGATCRVIGPIALK